MENPTANIRSKKEGVLNFIHQLVAQYSLTEKGRQMGDIFTSERDGIGAKGFRSNKQGFEVGWWVHPERYKKELDWLLDVLKLEGNESLLSVACGPAFHEMTLAHHFPDLHLMATDFDPKEIKTARKIADILGVTNISFKNVGAEQISTIATPHSIDVIMSLAALHEVADLGSTFRKMSKLLKPSGRLIFTYNPGRRVAHFPRQPSLEEILEKYFTLIHCSTLITAEDSLQYYGSLELKSQAQRGYGLVQEARIAIPKS